MSLDPVWRDHPSGLGRRLLFVGPVWAGEVLHRPAPRGGTRWEAWINDATAARRLGRYPAEADAKAALEAAVLGGGA